jgi:hypothetical protein
MRLLLFILGSWYIALFAASKYDQRSTIGLFPGNYYYLYCVFDTKLCGEKDHGLMKPKFACVVWFWDTGSQSRSHVTVTHGHGPTHGHTVTDYFLRHSSLGHIGDEFLRLRLRLFYCGKKKQWRYMSYFDDISRSFVFALCAMFVWREVEIYYTGDIITDWNVFAWRCSKSESLWLF